MNNTDKLYFINVILEEYGVKQLNPKQAIRRVENILNGWGE